MSLRSLLLIVSFLGIARTGLATEQPNVLLILVDDLGAHDLSIEGSTYYETPQIDRLARAGMRFSQGYATCRVCSPSRASIQLGQFTARHGITDWIGAKTGMDWNRRDRLLPAEYVRNLPHGDTTLAEAMQAAGYRTFFAGKWHLGGSGSLPTDHGFDVNRGGHEKGSPPGGYFSPYQNPLLEDGDPGESLPLRLADETVNWIQSAEDEPFFAMLSFYSVHSPVQTTRQLWSKYQQKAASSPEPSERFKVDRTMPVRQVQDHPVYAAMVELTDQAVGRVLDALEEAGLAESTIVIFTSDNGGVSSGDAYATSNLPLRGGKGRQWEGGIREPLYIRYPPVTTPGAICDVPVTGADFYPTVLELCSLPLRPEQHVDGVSLAPLLKGEPIADRPLYWHYPHYGNQGGEPGSMMRVGPWKLIHYYEDSRNELYNLQTDPSETIDVALSYPARTARMWRQLDEWLTSVHARRPIPDPRYSPGATEAKYARLHTQKKAELEKQHAALIQPDWQPDPTWYGSQARACPYVLPLVGLVAPSAATEGYSVRQITHGPDHHFFGYIGHVGTIPWNQSGRRLVALKVGFQDRMPTADDAAEIVLIDTHQDYAARVVDKTLAWNPQQGTMLYWDPRAPETRFFFNDRDPNSGKLYTVLFDISKGPAGERVQEFRFEETPFANSGVAQRGGYFLGINYARLSRLRPVTGYPDAFDWTVGTAAPTDDGIFLVDVEEGKARLLVSYAQLRDKLQATLPIVKNTPLFINHTLWNRDDERIFFYVRGNFKSKLPKIDIPMTIDPWASEPIETLAIQQPIGGHPEWENGHRLIGHVDDRQVLYDSDAKQVVGHLGAPNDFPRPGGDIALSPDGKRFVNGYGYKQPPVNYYAILFRADHRLIRTRAFSRGEQVSGELRIDPAPRWNRQGDQILISAVTDDVAPTRQLFVITLEETVDEQSLND